MKNRKMIIVVALLGVLLAGVLGTEMWLRRVTRDAVERTLGNAGARVEIGRVRVSLARRTVTVRDVRLRVQNSDPSHRGFTIVSLDGRVAGIEARGVRFKKAGDRRVVSIGRLTVTGASLDLVHSTGNDKSVHTTLSGGELTTRGVSFDSLSFEKLLSRSDLRLAVANLTQHTAGSSVALHAEGLAIETTGRMLTLKNFAIVPQFPKDEFAQRSEGHADWTSLTVSGIACAGLDFERLAAEKILSADSVFVAGVEIASYKNRKVFQTPRRKPMLYETLHKLPVPFDVRVLAFENLNIRYDELSEHGAAPGTITISGGGTVSNLTNIPAGHDRFTAVDIAATFMDRGALHATLLLPVDPQDDSWELTGHLGPMAMPVLNGVLEPLADIRVDSGRITALDFAVVGTDEKAHSTISMGYRDLSVTILNRRDHTRTRRLLTILADDFLIRPDNRTGRGNPAAPRETEGDYTRDPERSMWGCIWHTLQPAILRAVI